jgi:hypothetical protein
MPPPARVAAAAASAAGYRGHLTRRVRALTSAVTFAETTPSFRSLEDVEVKIRDVRTQMDKVEEAYLALLELDPETDADAESKGRRAAYEQFLDDLSSFLDSDIQPAMALLDRLYGKLRGTSVAPVASAGGAPAAAGRPKVVDALRPFGLSEDNTPAELRTWLERYEVYSSSSRLDSYSEREQQAFLFNCVDKKLERRIRSLARFDINLPVFGDNSVVNLIKEEFNIIHPMFHRRLEYFRSLQDSGQKGSDYWVQLKRIGEECDLHSLDVDQMYVFKCLAGVTDVKLREELLKIRAPSFDELRVSILTYEMAKLAAKTIDGTARAAVATTSGPGRQDRQRKKGQKGEPGTYQGITIPKEIIGKCFRCGDDSHMAGACLKGFNSLHCSKCNKKGHLSKVCMDQLGVVIAPLGDKARARSTSSRAPSRCASEASSGAPLSDEEESGEDAAKSVHVRSTKSNLPTPTFTLQLENDQGDTFEFSATPDTGATRTIFAKNLIRRWGLQIRGSSAQIKAANGELMRCSGAVKILATCPGGRYTIIHGLVSSSIQDEILVSWHDLQGLGILPKRFPTVAFAIKSHLPLDDLDRIKEDFPDVLCNNLDGGKVMTGKPMKIHLRTDIPIRPKKKLTARPAPLHWKKMADEEVQRLLDNGILKKVDAPTDWISRGHWVAKTDNQENITGLRLVTDFVDLNEYVERPVHPFPTAADILKCIKKGSKWFAKLDAVQGYFQIPLEEESSFLTTFLLPSGRYRYTRAPMGLCASGDEWCARSDQALQGLDFCQKLVDDILIQASTEEELFERVRLVLDRCRQYGISISRKKLEVGQQINYAGHVVSRAGVRPDPDKLAAIRDFPTPKDVTGVRSFLGMANQLGHFLPDLAHNTKKLRQLLKKEVAFVWLEDHEEEFSRAKEVLLSTGLVKYFDPSLPTTLLTDASRKNGLGYALIQESLNGKTRLIQCGSCSLSPAETRYATIELECLAAQYAVKKCSFYLRGMRKKFTIITDHRPLVGIFGHDLHDVENTRLQRMRGKMDGAGYCFDVLWQAGKEHLIADALSRAPRFKPDDDGDEQDDGVAVALVRTLSAATDQITMDDFKVAAGDLEYKAVVEAVLRGVAAGDLHPDHPGRAFKHVWERLGLLDSDDQTLLILDSNRIVVPAVARPEILRLLHRSHSGLVKTKKMAQQLYFWPGLTRDIQKMVESCESCAKFLPSQPVEPFLAPPTVSTPMEAAGVDLFDAAGSTYLLMVDRYSGYPFVHRLTRLNTAAVTKILLGWFWEFGFPTSIRSDGGPQFRSEFSSFCDNYGIKHELSSAYNPRSNGLAEAGVKNVKHLLLKCKEGGDDFAEGLFAFRNTPRADGFSPNQLFLGRRLRGGGLPALPSAFGVVDGSEAATASNKRRASVAASNDTAPGLSVLAIGQAVRVQDSRGRWTWQGQVEGVRDNHRSYEVSDEDGRLFVRNRRLLKPISSPVPDSSVSCAEPTLSEECSESDTTSGQHSFTTVPPNEKESPRRSARLRKKVRFS